VQLTGKGLSGSLADEDLAGLGLDGAGGATKKLRVTVASSPSKAFLPASIS